MFQIFERINTSGRTLSPQEIRNCIYHGDFNDLLFELNKKTHWRELLNCSEDIRMADIENILRFFAINNIQNTEFYTKNQIILKKFLNEYMASKVNISDTECNDLKNIFSQTIDLIYSTLGTTAFNNVSFKNLSEGEYSTQYVPKFHPTIFEAICCAYCYANNKIDILSIDKAILKQKHLDLLNDAEFKDSISNRTTNIENIKKRISLATKFLFDLTYDWN